MELTLIFATAFAVMCTSLIGVVFVWNRFGRWLESNLRYLISFAAGVFVIVSYGLFVEAHELSTDLTLLVLGAIAGPALLELITRMIPATHHHHGTENEHDHSPTDARRVLIGDAVHNIADGIVLVPAFLIDARLGLATALAVLLHEAVQEISEFFILRQAGYSNYRALVWNFIVSSTIFIGVFIGIAISNTTVLVPALMSFAAGAFLYVVFRDLLPSTVRAIVRNHNAGKHLLAVALGILVMFGVNIITPHSHGELDSHDHADETHMDSDSH